jgi:Ca2+-binding RTX toxin-like protein
MRRVQALAWIASAGLAAASLVLAGPASARDVVNGTGGDDQLPGTAFSDTIRGFGGNDGVHAFAGPDLIGVGSPAAAQPVRIR